MANSKQGQALLPVTSSSSSLATGYRNGLRVGTYLPSLDSKQPYTCASLPTLRCSMTSLSVYVHGKGHSKLLVKLPRCRPEQIAFSWMLQQLDSIGICYLAAGGTNEHTAHRQH